VLIDVEKGDLVMRKAGRPEPAAVTA